MQTCRKRYGRPGPAAGGMAMPYGARRPDCHLVSLTVWRTGPRVASSQCSSAVPRGESTVGWSLQPQPACRRPPVWGWGPRDWAMPCMVVGDRWQLTTVRHRRFSVTAIVNIVCMQQDWYQQGDWAFSHLCLASSDLFLFLFHFCFCPTSLLYISLWYVPVRYDRHNTLLHRCWQKFW